MNRAEPGDFNGRESSEIGSTTAIQDSTRQSDDARQHRGIHPDAMAQQMHSPGGVMHGLSEASVSADRAARGDATATDKVAAGAVDRPYAMIGPRFHMPTAASEERDP